MKMNIGVRAHDYGRHTPEELSSILKNAGFDSCQLAMSKALEGMDASVGKLNPGLCYSIRKAFEKNDIQISVLGCYIEPSLPDDEQRAIQVARFREHVMYARQLGGNVIGTETTNFRDTDESERSVRFGYLVDSVLQMVEAAERYGVIVGVEPVSVHTLNTPELTARLLDIVASDNLQIIFDPVNLITVDNIAHQDELLDRCFDAFGDRIVALHCKDVKLENGELKRGILGEGCLNYTKLMGWLKENRPGLNLIREGADPATADKDIAFLKSML